MGNEISHTRNRCRRFERLPAEERTDVPDVPAVPRAQPAQPGEFWGSESHPENETTLSDAAGMDSKEQERKREMASCSPPGLLAVVRSSELLVATGDNPPAANPGGEAQGAAGGHAEVPRRELPVQPAVEIGDGVLQTKQGPVKISSGLHRRPSSRVCRASPLCRWLKKLQTPAEKPQGKPGAGTSQE